jgi:rhodanese-related sulfurtransferase
MKNIEWSQLLKETALILSLTFIVAIIYNTLNPKGINLLKKPQVASDTLLEKLLSNTTTTEANSNGNPTKDEISYSDTVAAKKQGDNNKEKDKLIAEKPIESTPEEHSIGDIPIVTYSQLIKYLNSPNIILIDARSPEDYSKEHIGKAINIFAYEEDMNTYFQNLTKVPNDAHKVIIVYCEGGTCDASHKVAKDLIQLGYKNVFVYSGGWEEWTKLRGKRDGK